VARSPYRHTERWFSSWPILALAGVTLFLWHLWPSHDVPVGPALPPTPFTAEYVLLAPGTSVARLRPGTVAYRSDFGSMRPHATLDTDDLSFLLPSIPAARSHGALEARAASNAWDFSFSNVSRNPFNPGIDLPPPLPRAPLPAGEDESDSAGPLAPGSFWCRLSTGLENARFSFVPPDVPSTSTVGLVRIFVHTDDRGHVAHALLDTPSITHPAVRALLSAVERGTATRPATGFLEAGWLPPP
jgi:hypothetical protein